MANEEVMACVDGSEFSAAVCDYAAWVSRGLEAPLSLLHAIDHRHAVGPADLSGSIGLGSQETLLEQLAVLDQEAGKLALERGRLLLDAASARVTAVGVESPSVRQLHGSLVDLLVELESCVRVLVIGRRGQAAHSAQDHLGSNLERVIRAMHRPILVVPAEYREPKSFMVAFDNGPSTRKGVEALIRGPLFQRVECHLVTAGDPAGDMANAHAWARKELESAGISVQGGVYPGDAESVLSTYCHDHPVDLVVMGAYGHSRIRHLLVGSTTSAMIRRVATPLLLLR
ncbi:MAG: universal stress protein [Acidobacteria bacterium]|nr:universal stress protein [Acidobacteriota bacterium]